MIPLKKERREREHMKKIEEIKQVIDTINFEKAESIVLNPVIAPEKVRHGERCTSQRIKEQSPLFCILNLPIFHKYIEEEPMR